MSGPRSWGRLDHTLNPVGAGDGVSMETERLWTLFRVDQQRIVALCPKPQFISQEKLHRGLREKMSPGPAAQGTEQSIPGRPSRCVMAMPKAGQGILAGQGSNEEPQISDRPL